MKLKDLAHLLNAAVTRGAQKALNGCSGLADGITKAEAYRLYGRANVDRWVKEGLLKISNKNFDRGKLERVAESSNRITYLPANQRKYS